MGNKACRDKRNVGDQIAREQDANQQQAVQVVRNQLLVSVRGGRGGERKVFVEAIRK